MASVPIDLLIHNVNLATPEAGELPFHGEDLGNVIVGKGCAIAVSGGKIVAADSEINVRKLIADRDIQSEFDGKGMLAVPGFVDCHTHAVFGGDRAHEFALRNSGADYEAIHASGGGIHSTVSHTRNALKDPETFAGIIADRIARMVRAGSTTIEVKSGYGLTIDDELNSLRLLDRLPKLGASPTFARTILAAHTVPKEYADRAVAYLDEVAIPAVQKAAAEGVATAADIFLERGSFNQEQARHYLTAAAEAGLTLRMHSDQFSDQGGVELCTELGVRSADHLESFDERRARDFAETETVGVLLPISSLFLKRPYAPGKALKTFGAALALATDFNPGSSHSYSMPLAMSLAAINSGLDAGQLLTMATANAAYVLGLEGQVGRLLPGFQADICLFDLPSLDHLPYSPGVVPAHVFVRGVEAL